MPTSNYPQLAEMGIHNPLQIERYQVNGFGNHDVLRVVYERDSGSFLTSSRTYTFPRLQSTKAIGKGEKRPQAVMETHPELRKATEELDAVLKTKEHKECLAETVIAEVTALEEEIAMRSSYIKSLIKQLGE